MKSLLVTGAVLLSFGVQGFAEPPDQKPNVQNPPAGQKQQRPKPRSGFAGTKRPDIKVQPPQSPKHKGVQQNQKQQPRQQQHAKATPGPKAEPSVAQQVPPKAQVPFEQPTHAAPPPAPHVSSTRVLQKQVPPQHAAVSAPNSHVHNFVEQRSLAYRTAYHTQLLNLQKRYLAPAYLAPLRGAYRPWVKVGFLAYAYPVHPVVEFYSYFSNPCVAWFYNDYDAEFYQPFYGQFFARYPELRRGYNHVGIYLPTEEFMAMNVALSDLSIEAQVNYRRAMVFLGDRLAERYRAPIGRHQVIVNHYVMLPSSRAVVVEGFVDNESTQMPFKALIDLNNADNSELFAVSGWKADETPSVEQSQDLYDLNDQIVDYGGTVETNGPQS